MVVGSSTWGHAFVILIFFYLVYLVYPVYHANSLLGKGYFTVVL